MIHHRSFRHVVLGLCSFCFSAVSFAACISADVSKCVGSSKEIQLTVKARLQEASCNVSLGAKGGSEEKSLTFDFGNVLRSGLSYTDTRFRQQLIIYLIGCNDMFNKKAEVNFNTETCTADNMVACDGVHWAGVKIEDGSNSSYVEFNKWNTLALSGNVQRYSASYTVYLVKTDGSAENYSQSIQVMVRYN